MREDFADAQVNLKASHSDSMIPASIDLTLQCQNKPNAVLLLFAALSRRMELLQLHRSKAIPAAAVIPLLEEVA